MKERVRFEVAGELLVGDLYLPPSAGPHPAVVVAGPMTSVKEQVTGVYARALAERGFAALAFDHRYYGESGGAPRQYERASDKIADLRAALEWLGTRPAIDSGRLGLVGVCLGAGYAAWASIDNPRVKALGAVAGYYRNVSELRAKDPAGFQAKVDQGIRARERYESQAEVLTIPAAALTGDAAMTMAETYDYYGTARAAVPNYVNALAVMSREHFLPFDVQQAAPLLAAPLLMVHSDKALSPAWARQFHEQVKSPKRLEWVASQGQVDFYDHAPLVSQACELLAQHLGTWLVREGSPRAA